MREPWGRDVDNPMQPGRRSVAFSVDRKAHIVRNPPGGIVQGAYVDNRWKMTTSCSTLHLLADKTLGHAIHNAPVLTGTTTGCFSLKI